MEHNQSTKACGEEMLAAAEVRPKDKRVTQTVVFSLTGRANCGRKLLIRVHAGKRRF